MVTLKKNIILLKICINIFFKLYFSECSAKSSEGFKLHKGIIKYAYTVPTVTECERMCHSESKFHCYTYSYR